MNIRKLIFTAAMALPFTVASTASFAEQPVIQTQMSAKGYEVDLLRAKVSGNYLSVIFMARYAGDGEKVYVAEPAHDVYFIDDAEGKKYLVLKDKKGAWLEDGTNGYLDQGEKLLMQYKFPIPPENVKKINITLPDVMPFDDVEITR